MSLTCRVYRPSDEGHTTGWACYDTDHTSLMNEIKEIYGKGKKK
jgi:hypothetical protein